MNVPVVLGRPGEMLVFYTAEGAEGQSIRLLQVKGGELVDVKSGYRYHRRLSDTHHRNPRTLEPSNLRTLEAARTLRPLHVNHFSAVPLSEV